MSNITLPLELVNYERFSLGEIGAITVISALPQMSKDDKEKWEKEPSLIKQLADLQDKGIIEYDGDEIFTIHIEESEKPFWELETYDDQDNPIYYTSSPIGCEDSTWYWRVKPVLVDLKLVWEDISDEDLNSSSEGEYFTSLEEAEKWFKQRNEEIIKDLREGILL